MALILESDSRREIGFVVADVAESLSCDSWRVGFGADVEAGVDEGAGSLGGNWKSGVGIRPASLGLSDGVGGETDCIGMGKAIVGLFDEGL